MIPVNAEAQGRRVLIVAEPTEPDQTPTGLAIGRTLLNFRSNYLVIRAANLSDATLGIEAGQNIARGQPIEQLQTPDKWLTEEVQKAQEDDHDIGPILGWKIGGARPAWEDISNSSEAVKCYWAQWNSLSIESGLLKRRWESADGRSCIMQLIPPKRMVEEVLEKIHGVASGGHLGVNKTLPKVREPYRAAVHESTGETPSRMIFGREIRLPCDIEFGRLGETEMCTSDYLSKLVGRMAYIHRHAR
ncbi:hypothetical protein J437_LFUL018503 [Ladona fulva]|uniref:Integrase zinc-binding domain-containing protein n=1 Tax=Ladona fulva TaxID=123851 RepID=A0A8K0P7M4_LADFU|nr:hypothetical protein J437_LFUL018503 [Ladona fulva]